MGFYDKKETAEKYIKIAKGYDGKELIDKLKEVLAPNSSVLELGSGPGVDLDLLTKYFKATGSDNSKYFVQRYKKMHPAADMIILDAISLPITRTFDAIYSNKVLHHLNDEDLASSFANQHEILNKEGLIMHSFWNGDSIEDHHGLLFHNRTISRIEELLNGQFLVIQQKEYSEFEPDDSHWLLARKH